MDELSALDVAAMRAVETCDATRALWSDDDRAWASRAAAEIVGADAMQDAFLARRAALVVERLGARRPVLLRTIRALRWRPWVGAVLVAGAFVLGMFIDQVGAAQRINILAPPVLGLIGWNIAVYVFILAGYVVRYGDEARPGPLRRALARGASGLSRPRRSGALRDIQMALATDWARRSAALYAVRAGRILHLSAAALAAGVIAGLYLRGIAFEYRASWESTFFDPPVVHAIAAIAYAPGAYVTGIPVPDTEAVAAIRAPLSENAARWLHLMAATMLVLVIVPRLVLASVAGMIERHRSRRIGSSFDDAYFQRMLRAYRGGPAGIRVVPYSYAVTPAVRAGLQAVVSRAFGGDARLWISPPVGYGDEGDLAAKAEWQQGDTVIALFSATATPEHEVHGAFLAKLRGQAARIDTLLAIVDEGAFRARWPLDATRIAQRRDAWRRLAVGAQVAIVFVDLLSPDLGGAEAAIDAVVAQAAT